jgi:hypothetical protein
MTKHLLSLVAVVGLSGLVLSASAQNSPAPSQAGSAAQQQQVNTPTPQPTPFAPSQSPSPSSQPALSNAAQPNGVPRIAPGSVLPVRLMKSVDAKKAKVGEEVEATVTQDMKTGTGEVLVPKDTKVIGHVTETQPRSKEQKESQVGLAFDHAVMNGGNVPLPMSIQAIIASPTATPGNSDVGGQGAMPSSVPGASGASSSSSSGRPGGMSAGPPPEVPTNSGAAPSGGQTGTNAQPPITGNTQGVVGISNLKLSAGADSAQGSVLSSEKNNVKIESGTLMLLRVNP